MTADCSRVKVDTISICIVMLFRWVLRKAQPFFAKAHFGDLVYFLADTTLLCYAHFGDSGRIRNYSEICIRKTDIKSSHQNGIATAALPV
jgi:hypothetical protein